MFHHAGADTVSGTFAAEFADTRLDLSTKVGIVTGGGRGIGSATCVSLAKAGIKAVAVVDLLDDLDGIAKELNAKIGRDALIPFRGDVCDTAFRRHVFAEMKKRFGPVSICVPAAGITRDRLAVRKSATANELEIYPEADFRKVIEIDLMAPIYWAMETIAQVAEDRAARGLKRWMPSEIVEGCIVLIGSVSSLGNKGQISYAAAKAGLDGAQGTLAAEANYHGVRCTIIHPGYTDTAMVRALGDKLISDLIVPQTHLKRLLHPNEVADAILFMIRNPAISGQLWVDGGWHPIV